MNRTAPTKSRFSFNAGTKTFVLNFEGKMENLTLSIENIKPLQRKQCPCGSVHVFQVDKPGFPYNEVFLRDIAEGDKMLVHNTLLKLFKQALSIVQYQAWMEMKPDSHHNFSNKKKPAQAAAMVGGLCEANPDHTLTVPNSTRWRTIRVCRCCAFSASSRMPMGWNITKPNWWKILASYYLKMRTFCGARKLRDFAFADEADLEDFKQFKCKIAKRLNYHANKKKALELEEKRKRAKSVPFLMKSKESPERNEQTTDSSNSAAENPIDPRCDVCGQKEHTKTSTCPKSLWKLITRDTDGKLTAKDANKATVASADPKIAQQKLAQNSNNNNGYFSAALHLSSAVNRGTMTRPNAGIKRRYSPGVDVEKRPKTAAGFH